MVVILSKWFFFLVLPFLLKIWQKGIKIITKGFKKGNLGKMGS